MSDTRNEKESTERTRKIRNAFRLADALTNGTDPADRKKIARILNYNLDQLEKDIQAANELLTELWAQAGD